MEEELSRVTRQAQAKLAAVWALVGLTETEQQAELKNVYSALVGTWTKAVADAELHRESLEEQARVAKRSTLNIMQQLGAAAAGGEADFEARRIPCSCPFCLALPLTMRTPVYRTRPPPAYQQRPHLMRQPARCMSGRSGGANGLQTLKFSRQ